MARMSEARPLQGETARQRAMRQPLMLGLFLPHQQGAWSPSTAPRGTDWRFDYNAECAVRADELGFDLVFALAQWLGKGGYGGTTRFREHTLDPFVASAGLAPITRNVLLIATVHILYGWHPLHLAKYGAIIHHMSGGRWGLNVVTGYKPSEFHMFGLPQVPHDERYAMADEFTTVMRRLWTEDEDLDFDGRWWRTEGAFVAEKPAPDPITLVNAASSGAGLDYAAKHSDIIFTTSPAGHDVAAACAALPDHVAAIRARATALGRDVKVLINPHVICRPTEAEAQARFEEIMAGADREAIDTFHASIGGGDHSSWKGHGKDRFAVGGNLHVVGTPAQVTEWFVRLKAAGIDGVQVNFFDFLPEIEFFGRHVLPLMREAGLRLD
jgi:dimethylsulfone monooxygenase